LSKTSKAEKKQTVYWHWYEYNGIGDSYDPESYTVLSSAPACNYAKGNLCAIYALGKDDYPDPQNLSDLGASSATFTQPYTGLYGKVRLTEH
jgi:hypothetical protein